MELMGTKYTIPTHNNGWNDLHGYMDTVWGRFDGKTTFRKTKIEILRQFFVRLKKVSPQT